MFEVTIGDEKVKAEVTFYTAHLYQLEFMGDIIQDFYGRQDVALDPDPEGAQGDTEDDGELTVTLDFTLVSWNAVLKSLWAAIKTADESTPSFTEWLKGAKGMDALVVRGQLDEAIADCFLRPQAAR